MHLGGKIEVRNKVPIKTRDDLSMAYTPAGARVCLAIHDDRQRAFSLTIAAAVAEGVARAAFQTGLARRGRRPDLRGRAERRPAGRKRAVVR